MKLKIIETERAFEEATSIANRIAQDAGLIVSDRFLESLLAAYDRLSDFPMMGTARTHGSSALSGLRMWPVPNFRKILIYYVPTEVELKIVHVVHGAQDIARIFEHD